MIPIETIREYLRPIFEDGKEGDEREDQIMLWPFFLWIFISGAAGFYGSLLVSEVSRLYLEIVIATVTAAILAKPMARLSVRKTPKTKD